jgi:DNA invertase Pin-like site-specific DNA recombinase
MARSRATGWTREAEQAALERLRTRHLPVLVYARQSKSTFDGEERPEGPSLDQQIAACQKRPELVGCAIEVFSDPDRSGKETSKRPGYLAMMDRLRDAAEGSIGAIFCYDQDRLHRNVVEFYRFMEEAEDRGVLVF